MLSILTVQLEALRLRACVFFFFKVTFFVMFEKCLKKLLHVVSLKQNTQFVLTSMSSSLSTSQIATYPSPSTNLVNLPCPNADTLYLTILT